jgi:hypothetical protein
MQGRLVSPGGGHLTPAARARIAAGVYDKPDGGKFDGLLA